MYSVSVVGGDLVIKMLLIISRSHVHAEAVGNPFKYDCNKPLLLFCNDLRILRRLLIVNND